MRPRRNTGPVCACGRVKDPWAERCRPCANKRNGERQRGSGHHMWRGGTKVYEGRVYVLTSDHPHAVKGYVRRSLLVAELAIGHYLPRGVIIHHANEITDDDRPSNLAVLQDLYEHIELHRKLRVLRAGGNPFTDALCHDCGPRPIASFPRKSDRTRGLGLACRCSECRNRHDREQRLQR